VIVDAVGTAAVASLLVFLRSEDDGEQEVPESVRQPFFLSIFRLRTMSFLLSKLEMERVCDFAPSFSA
jgi:hypothetical protein